MPLPRITKRHARLVSLTAHEQDRVAWLEETLIPDLNESGFGNTADDFVMCIGFIDRLAKRLCTLEVEAAVLRGRLENAGKWHVGVVESCTPIRDFPSHDEAAEFISKLPGASDGLYYLEPEGSAV